MMVRLISHASGAVDRITAGGKYEAGRQIRLLVQGAGHRNPLFGGRQRGGEFPSCAAASPSTPIAALYAWRARRSSRSVPP